LISDRLTQQTGLQWRGEKFRKEGDNIYTHK
jgi:hypothetical protein